jgi:hypothetical protein
LGKKKSGRRRIERVIRGGLVRLSPRRKKVPSSTNGTASSSMRMETVHIPSHIGEGPQDGTWFRLGPIMTTILLLGLVWIAIVAWFASTMPAR